MLDSNEGIHGVFELPNSERAIANFDEDRLRSLATKPFDEMTSFGLRQATFRFAVLEVGE